MKKYLFGIFLFLFCLTAPMGALAASGEAGEAAPDAGKQSQPAAEEEEYPEADEAEKISWALKLQGYFRDDVPMDYALQDALHTSCYEFGIPYEVGLAVIQTESGFQPYLDAGRWYGLCMLMKDYFPSNLEPWENIHYGMELIHRNLLRYGNNMEAALTAYNAGSDTGDRSYASLILSRAAAWKAKAPSSEWETSVFGMGT